MCGELCERSGSMVRSIPNVIRTSRQRFFRRQRRPWPMQRSRTAVAYGRLRVGGGTRVYCCWCCWCCSTPSWTAAGGAACFSQFPVWRHITSRCLKAPNRWYVCPLPLQLLGASARPKTALYLISCAILPWVPQRGGERSVEQVCKEKEDL